MARSINLSELPLPDAIDVPDFELLLAERKAAITALFPADQQEAVSRALELLSEPVVKVLEEQTYRQIIFHQRVNEAVRAVLLASTSGNDMDQLGGNFDVGRFVITPGNDAAIPPVPPQMEPDEQFRERIQLSWGRLSTAGADDAYIFFAKSADEDVLDARPYGPETHGEEGRVYLYILSRTGDGTAPPALLDTVRAVVNDKEVRPLTDFTLVNSALIVNYEVVADIHIPYGLDGDIVISNAREKLRTYTDSIHQFDTVIARSGIDGALHQPGVITVVLQSPPADITMGMGEVPFCTDVTLNKVVIENE